MKKLYALLFGVFVAAFLLLGQDAFAQYTPGSYTVQKNADTWNAISGGTQVKEIMSTSAGDFFQKVYEFSNEITIPFNIQFVNLLTNKIKISGSGSIVMGGSASVPDNIIYDYEAWIGYYQFYYNFNYGGNYQYGTNNQLMAWTGSTFPCKPDCNVQYQTQGTAPNRIFYVEVDGWGNYAAAYDEGYNNNIYSNYGPTYLSWQYKLYEGSSFISKFDIDYGPWNGNINGGSNPYGYTYNSIENGTCVCGIRTSPLVYKSIYLGNFNSLSAGTSMTSINSNGSYSGYYDVGGEYYPQGAGPTGGFTLAIRYPYNACFTHPSPSPLDQAILLINNAITPTVSLSNEGQNPFTALSVTCTIVQSGVGQVYSNTVALSGTQMPAAQGGTGTPITFATYTPTAYGLYTITYALTASTPADQYTPDNTFVTQFICSPPNNVASVAALLPAAGSRTPVGYATPVSFRYRNLGVNAQSNTPVSVYITNPQGAVVYRDTAIIPYWVSTPGFAIRDTTFKDFVPQTNGNYTLCGVTLLANDQNHADDTVCGAVIVRYLADVAAITVLNPDDQEEKPEKKQFRPQGTFQSVGVEDLFDVPARYEIHRCSDNTILWGIDSTIPELNTDAGPVKFSFPAVDRNNPAHDIAKLAPGCYNICMFSKEIDDGDHSNDTACQQFSIIPRLSGVIQVGAGRHFQSITAAVDSMRFRGIGGNLLLQLTDQNYTENGTTDVASAFSAVDMGGIVGTGPTAVVTWQPLPNVFPTITFTGNKQYCINYDELSPQYMVWDGYNLQAPTTDAVTPEPNKRGMKIVNNSSTPGSIFRMAHGRTYLTFKNLNLINNGNLTDNASRAIDMQNLYDQYSYFQYQIKDTSAIHDITVDNCFIGNANYAISDSGTNPMFDVGKTVFVNIRNFNNRFSRNTIGSQQYPIGSTGIFLSNEDGLQITRNEISWITGASTTNGYDAAITAMNGNHVNLLINGNKIHNISAPNTSGANVIAGIDIQQAALIYVFGTGPAARSSQLPQVTGNRIVNNFIYDMRVNTSSAGTNSVMPIRDMTVNSATYTVQNDSVFNNSIAIANTEAVVTMNHVANPFLFNNIYQNLNTNASATAVLYNLTVPRPMFSAVSSNYNMIDFRNATLFANMHEYDYATGVATYNVTIPNLNGWHTLTQQDLLTPTGDPLFTMDSLHLPLAATYIYTQASNAGLWLGSATQATDIDGDPRITGGSAPDIGADEFDGFQYVNDLAVKVITKPSGISDNNGITLVTAETPLAIQAIVQNLGAVIAPNRAVTTRVDYSTNGGVTWIPIKTTVSAPMTWAVNEWKVVDLVGPAITGEVGKLFRVTVSVPNDQNNSNNTLTKIFRITVKRQGTLLTYNSSTLKGRQNKDSLAAALQRLSVPYDSLDRDAYSSNPIDYTPWWTIVWSTGDPTTPYYTNGVTLGSGSVSQKEEQEIINYLTAGQTYAKKSLIIAGENIAQYLDTAATNSFKQLNNVVTDGEFMLGWMHTRFVGQYAGQNYPTATPNQYRGLLQGTGLYFVFADSLANVANLANYCVSPDVVRPTPVTGTVGTNTSRFAYFYTTHPSTPMDSGAGTAWNGAKSNIVFYAFDWADPGQTVGLRDGEIAPVNVSGTTRFLRGALDFIKSFGGTVLPVEFTSIKGDAKADGNLITWSVSGQKDIDHYEVELLGDNTWNWAGTVKANNTDNYSFLHSAESALQIGKTYTYRVEGVGIDGSRNASNTVNVERTASGSAFTIAQNYPNPFSGSTVIGYSVPENGTVSLRVLDLTGKVVSTGLDNAMMTAGSHTFTVDANGLASGTYIYEVSFTNSNGETSVLRSKMTLDK
ncbi:MAG TPA: T9SS type A sorting domain-containing protein [Candidatus Kapabacteria bacterium]|nr:T9SS type A sorting domain-containing protein [Candidatus Kapabacteria bacterium]